jgi:hemolysin D
MKSVMVVEQPVILERPQIWSRIYVWLIIGIVTSSLIWAAVAELEQAVPATGKLEPQGSVQEIKAPAGGVVQTIEVQDGQRVKKGQRLLSFDPTAAKAELESLIKLRASLIGENQFYQSYPKAMGDSASIIARNDWQSLMQLRATLVAENQAYKAELAGQEVPNRSGEFNANQQKLVIASQSENRSRLVTAQLQIQELQKQFSQNQAQLANAKKILGLNQNISQRMRSIVAEGAISEVQVQKQEQEALSRQSEVERLQGEQERLSVSVIRAREQVQQVLATADKEVLTKIAENQKRMAEIDTQLSRTQLENQKKITEIDSQISKAKVALQYQELRSPVEGVVFNLQAHAPGFVANTTQPILSVVPGDRLIASVELTNKDIGSIQPGMPVDIKIESFPESEFGSINGKLTWLGSDALPPTQSRPFYAFPAKIELERQSMSNNGKILPLQSGMAVNCNIKLRKRTFLSLFLDMFDKKVKSLESVR